MSGRLARRSLAVLVACALAVAALAVLGGSREQVPLPADKPAERAGDASDAGSVAERALSAADATRTRSALSAADEAARVLADLRDRGDCALVQSGYLDLSGRVWGCVTQGDGWSEVWVVSSDESGSEVVTLRMDASDVRGEPGAR